jgi:uncharacterized protein
LEGALNDAVSKRIISEIVTPKFREADFYGGISEGIDQMVHVIQGEPLPAAKQTSTENSSGFGNFVPVIFILAIVIGSALRAIVGKLPGALLTGGIMIYLAWLVVGVISIAIASGFLAFLFTLLGGGTRSLIGGQLGRGIGGHGGGFGGGGGGFGGGGASGRW